MESPVSLSVNKSELLQNSRAHFYLCTIEMGTTICAQNAESFLLGGGREKTFMSTDIFVPNVPCFTSVRIAVTCKFKQQKRIGSLGCEICNRHLQML